MTTSRTTPRRVAIIGAGISGLAHAEVLTRCGFSVVLFERAPRLGGVWAHAYPEVSLQNTWWGYHVSTFPWPFVPDEHPTGEQILRYLQALVAARGFDVRLEHEVVEARQVADGWSVRVRGPAGESVESFDHLVVSVGQYTEGKHRPQLKGEEEFGGAVVTEREVGDLASLAGKRVVVVGFGKSALDMATFAVVRAHAVHHVFRTPRWTLPRLILGVHYTKLLFNRFGSVMMTAWAHPTAFERFLHRRTGFVASFWGALERLFTRIVRREGRGHGAAGETRLAAVIPEHELVRDLRSAAALATPGYYRHSALARSNPTGATSSRCPGMPFTCLPVKRCPRISWSSPWGRARRRSRSSRTRCGHSSRPRMTGCSCIVTSSIRGSPTSGSPVSTTASCTSRPRRSARCGWLLYGVETSPAVNTRFQQYLDIMLADLDLSPYRKLPNVFAELFAPYRPSDYAGVVDAYLSRRGGRSLVPVALPT